jgi:hypothetical protein
MGGRATRRFRDVIATQGNDMNHERKEWSHGFIKLAVTLLFGSACAHASAVDIGPGFTGAWFDPQQSGHGLFLEVLPDKQLLAFWFTFTPDGTEQSWFGGVGPYSGNTASVPVALTTGGRWIPNFDPSKRVDHPWGRLAFTFTDCDHGRVDFTSTYPGYGNNHMDLTRLTAPAGLTCTSTKASNAKGVWTGTTSINESAIVIVLEDGSYEIVYSRVGNPADAGVVRGTSSADAASFSSTDAMNYPVAQTTEAVGAATAASVSGTFVAASTLELTLTTRSGTRTLAASYVAASDQAPSLGGPAGAYSGYNGHIGGRQNAVFTVDGAGNVAGSNAAGCTYVGAIAPRPALHVFDLSVVPTNSQCIFGSTHLSGLLYYDEIARQVHAFALFADGAGAADQYFIIGAKN